MASKPMYFPPAPFNLKDAVACSDLVDLAYAMYADWVTQGKPHHPNDFHWQPPQDSPYRFAPPVWGDSKVLFFKDWEPFALVAQHDGNAYAIVRGTESVEDWIDDVECDQISYELPNISGVGLVHEGFFNLYKTMREALLDQINALSGVETLFITGHSLGAALAMVATPDLVVNALRNQAKTVFQYNLAGPRACDPALASFLNGSAANIYRVVNSCDVVPEVPPSVYDDADGRVLYEHVGYPVTYTAQYESLAGNHAHHASYNYALTHPECPQGPN